MTSNREKIFSKYCTIKKIDNKKLIDYYYKLYNKDSTKEDNRKVIEEIEEEISEVLFNKFKNQKQYYSKKKIKEYYTKFKWQKKNAEESIKIRNKAAKKFQDWANSLTNQANPNPKAEEMFNHVLEWGFGNKDFFNSKIYINSNQNKKDNLKKFCKFIYIWTNEGKREDKKESHLSILNITGVGIARSSKWICFIDQEKYAIYDSRVSLALSKIKNAEGDKPFFQVLQRRNLKDTKYPKGNSRTESLTVDDYFIFLKFINKVADDYEIPPYKVEMSLFMMGDDDIYYDHLPKSK